MDPKMEEAAERASQIRTAESKAKEKAFIEWLKGYLDTIALVGGLGSSITFSIIVSQIVDPAQLDPNQVGLKKGAVFNLDQVRLVISLGWAFFTIAVGLSIFAKVLFIDPIAQRNLEKNMKSTGFQVQLAVTLFLLNLLPIFAFMLISLAVTAYVPVVGWIATFFAGFAGLLGLVMSTGLVDIGPSIPRLIRDISE
ncbi:hypothetical protein TWF694_007352 [Orbilia ellipsospora]|uniref:Uncharacterized protein n=1 Tax=Orbilia ellipsospora TaxID=2528407 RepID=A0AAV9XHW9_9PEZI